MTLPHKVVEVGMIWIMDLDFVGWFGCTREVGRDDDDNELMDGLGDFAGREIAFWFSWTRSTISRLPRSMMHGQGLLANQFTVNLPEKLIAE